MPSKNLTAAFVSRAKPIDGRTTEYRDTKTPCLAIRVTPKGIAVMDVAISHQ